MRIEIPKHVQGLGTSFAKLGLPLYMVGGAVRNSILGYPPSDYDICGSATPEQVTAAFAGTQTEVLPVAPAFGTVLLCLPWQGGGPRHTLEYTTFRRDTYGPGGGHRPEGVVFSTKLEEDAFRRDFTVNALYANVMTGEVIDPTGGLADLERRQLRASSPDPDVILRDDGLRSLRLVRFAAELGFEAEPASAASAKRHAPLLADIPVERIWKELQRMLLSDVRYNAPQPGGLPAQQRAMAMLVELGLMEYVFPELLEGAGVEQRTEYHAYDVLTHNIVSCGCARPGLALRLAALLHDVGKPRALAENGRMLFHDRIGAEMAEAMLLRLKTPRKLAQRVALLIRRHMFDLDENAKTATLRKRFAQLGPEVVRELADLREADFLGSGRQTPPVRSRERFLSVLADMEAEGAPFTPNDLKLNGKEIEEIIGPGPLQRIGRVKEQLWMHCAVKPRDNVPERLKKLAKSYANASKLQEQEQVAQTVN